MRQGGDLTTLDDVKRAILDGRMQFWPLLDSAVVTQVVSQGQELNIFLAGGSLNTLRQTLNSLEAFGQARGCKVVTILGRLGWMRSFLTRDAGYSAHAVLLAKELPDVQRSRHTPKSEQ
jgi:hypothetical protein